MNLVLYIHGMGGSHTESEHYKSLFPDYDVIGLDYKTFTPWETGKEIHDTVSEFKSRYEKIILIANSIGAFFSMNADLDGLIEKAYFISPIADMEFLICNMMKAAGVTEVELEEKKVISTSFGPDLSWEYLTYVREHPLNWKIPTSILYGENDNFMPFEIISKFSQKHNSPLTVMKDGEHWFHSPEQMNFLDNWICRLSGK